MACFRFGFSTKKHFTNFPKAFLCVVEKICEKDDGLSSVTCDTFSCIFNQHHNNQKYLVNILVPFW